MKCFQGLGSKTDRSHWLLVGSNCHIFVLKVSLEYSCYPIIIHYLLSAIHISMSNACPPPSFRHFTHGVFSPYSPINIFFTPSQAHQTPEWAAAVLSVVTSPAASSRSAHQAIASWQVWHQVWHQDWRGGASLPLCFLLSFSLSLWLPLCAVSIIHLFLNLWNFVGWL